MGIGKMPELRLGDKVARLPIVQGGMGVGISLKSLASAVANAGGVGIIATAGIGYREADYERDMMNADRRALRQEIRDTRLLTKGLIGVNIMLARTDFASLLRVSLEEEVDVVVLSAGLPLQLPKGVALDQLRSSKTVIAPKVSSARAVRAIFKYWSRHYDHIPDAVFLEGPLAGGHLGFTRDELKNPDQALERILTETVAVLRPFEEACGHQIPIIAGGGVFTGGDIYDLLKLGASAALMGTRFVTTHECDIHPTVKEAYIQCGLKDLTIIDSPVGLPGRALRNRFLDEVNAGERKPYQCLWRCLSTCDVRNAPYCIAKALINAKMGRLDEGFAFAGANAHRIKSISSVAELMDQLVQEYLHRSSAMHPVSPSP